MPEQARANLDALSDLCTPWCLHVVATLRIADHVAAGLTGIDDLAAAAGCDSEALHSVLTHLAGKGVFQEPAPGRFALNGAAQELLDPSQRLALDLEGIGGRFASAWGTLLTYVRTGKPAYHEVFGRPFWEDLEAHPDVAASFDALIGPAGHGLPNAEVQLTGGWEAVRTVVDVGGGTGAMLATRPPAIQQTERIINTVFSHVLGQLVDLGLGSRGLSRRAAELVVRNTRPGGWGDAEWPVLVQRMGGRSATSLWTAWSGRRPTSTASTRQHVADAVTRQRAADDYDERARSWANRVRTAQEIIAEGLAAVDRPLR